MKTTQLTLFFVFLSSFLSYSQNYNHEFGVSIGAVSIQSDYGERGDFASSYGNVGFGVGLNYYFSFDNSYSRWNAHTSDLQNHFRLKLGASYMQDHFIHRGRYIESLSVTAIKMAAMRGSTKIYNFGGQIEYAIFDFMDERKLEPYLAIGLYYVFYDPDLTSELGDWKDNPSLIPTVYQNGSIHLEKDKTQSFSFGFGSRYAIGESTKMVFDFRWQKFLTNNIDGLDPQLGANKFRDWLLYAQVGVVFKVN